MIQKVCSTLNLPTLACPGGGAQSRVATKPALQAATSVGGPAEDDNVDRFWSSSPAGLSFGYDERACMSPQVSPPAGSMGFQPQPQFYGQPGQFPYGYTPYVSPSPFGGWQGMQGPCPQGPYFGPPHYAGPVPSAQRDRDDTASVSLSSVSESELEKEEEGSPPVVGDDPTDGLTYTFEETPLTLVHVKVANLMNQALKETSVKN